MQKHHLKNIKHDKAVAKVVILKLSYVCKNLSHSVKICSLNRTPKGAIPPIIIGAEWRPHDFSSGSIRESNEEDGNGWTSPPLSLLYWLVIVFQEYTLSWFPPLLPCLLLSVAKSVASSELIVVAMLPSNQEIHSFCWKRLKKWCTTITPLMANTMKFDVMSSC